MTEQDIVERLTDALRLLLNYTVKSRQGYVLIPLADKIAEATAEHALALADGYGDYAKAKAEQIEELRAMSNDEIDKMNAALLEKQNG